MTSPSPFVGGGESCLHGPQRAAATALRFPAGAVRGRSPEASACRGHFAPPQPCPGEAQDIDLWKTCGQFWQRHTATPGRAGASEGFCQRQGEHGHPYCSAATPPAALLVLAPAAHSPGHAPRTPTGSCRNGQALSRWRCASADVTAVVRGARRAPEPGCRWVPAATGGAPVVRPVRCRGNGAAAPVPRGPGRSHPPGPGGTRPGPLRAPAADAAAHTRIPRIPVRIPVLAGRTRIPRDARAHASDARAGDHTSNSCSAPPSPGLSRAQRPGWAPHPVTRPWPLSEPACQKARCTPRGKGPAGAGSQAGQPPGLHERREGGNDDGGRAANRRAGQRPSRLGYGAGLVPGHGLTMDGPPVLGPPPGREVLAGESPGPAMAPGPAAVSSTPW
jgi:hypothetical protein